MNDTNGKEAEAKASQWKKLATELRPDQKRACGQGAGAFSFSVVKEDGGTGTGTGRGWSADCTPVRVVWQSNHSRLRSAVVGLLYLLFIIHRNTITPYLSFPLPTYSTPHSLSLRVSTL
jgi:hypothetical protein